MADGSGSSAGYKEYVAGMLAGVATVVVGHPFDTVKVKLQKHNTGANGMKYKSGFHCTAAILKADGVKGLYRGATPSFVGMTFESSLLFGIYSQTKQLLQGEEKKGKPQLYVTFPSGAFAGAVISFILCPSELVKCRVQVQGSFHHHRPSIYSGPIDCALKTVKSEGLKGIFRGGSATLLRESLGNGIFFSTYEHLRHYMRLPLRDSSSDPTHFVDVGIGIAAGGFSGIAFWCAVLPLDVAKTVIQTSSERTQSRNPFRILESIHRRAGMRGCYTGLAPTIVRAFPANAAAIVTWEMAMKLLGIERE